MEIKLRIEDNRITGWKVDSFNPLLHTAEITTNFTHFRKYFRWYKLVDGKLLWDDNYLEAPENTVILEIGDGYIIPCYDLKVIAVGQTYITTTEYVDSTELQENLVLVDGEVVVADSFKEKVIKCETFNRL